MTLPPQQRPPSRSRRARSPCHGAFAAPRTLVFSMFTEAKHLAAWWGPHGFTNPVCEADRAAERHDPDPHAGARRHRASDGRPLPRGRAARAHRVHVVRRPAGRQAHPRRPQHRDVRGAQRPHHRHGARARRRLCRLRGAHARRHGGRLVARASTSSWATRRTRPARTTRPTRRQIRAIFGDRTNALFGKVRRSRREASRRRCRVLRSRAAAAARRPRPRGPAGVVRHLGRADRLGDGRSHASRPAATSRWRAASRT